MQKMARDKLKAAKKGSKGGSPEEERLCVELGAALAKGSKTGWTDNYRTVYALAEAIMARTMAEQLSAGKARL